MFPSIDSEEVGNTGLLWLFLTYGFVLYHASNLISEGSDLLMLIPSLAGLVGSVVLPLLGAVPDGAIMLFSGLGDISEAQETLSVGVGALAGSTIMLLTVPWALSVIGGRVDLSGPGRTPNYMHHPKLTLHKAGLKSSLLYTGVLISEEVRHGAVIMAVTTIPYFIIQIPASLIHGPKAAGEKNWALAGLCVCLVGFVSYLALQLKISDKGQDRDKRVAVMKKLLLSGAVSLSTALAENVKSYEESQVEQGSGGDSYQAVDTAEDENDDLHVPPKVREYLAYVLKEAFMKYDRDGSNHLEKAELRLFFRDFHETIDEDAANELFSRYDRDGDNTVSFDEFIALCYSFIKSIRQGEHEDPESAKDDKAGEVARDEILASIAQDESGGEGGEEEEDIPEDLSDLSPEEQMAAVKRRAFFMLAAGTALVVLFSDPMVDVMQEIASRTNLPPFYVAFILTPLASNASEVLASQYYARKKTRKTITVSLTALEGAASMNNTFCLSIFMGLIYFRGLAWQYTAETIAIVLVQYVVALSVRGQFMTTLGALGILSVFPISIALVAGLEAIGFD